MTNRAPSWTVTQLVTTLLTTSLLLGGCAMDIKRPWPDGIDPCSPNPCTKNGACENWTATCKINNGGNGYTCSDWKPSGEAPKGSDGQPLTKPEKFEDNELSCDGVDNDCDGETDEGLIGDPTKDCGNAGICSGAVVPINCVGGAWRCDFSVLPGFEVSETTCDGKDNDCDGQTDESVSPKPGDCRRAGVCAGLPPATCSDGAWDCGYAAAPAWEASETSCDGKDNDCDGKIDVGLALSALPGGGKCSNTGVCAGGVSIVCKGGVPTCDHTAIKDYQVAELACDGKDNDCDGKTDNLQGTDVPLTDNKTTDCKSDGVCKVAATSISRRCSGGQWDCNYDAVSYYEAKETLCDGRDNDCDGTIDNGLPAPKTSPCDDKGVCAQGEALCANGLWQCDYKTLATKGYEAFEGICDGKDNDCDGQTDEQVNPTANGCKAKGVCAVGVPVTCSDGKGTCDYDAVPLYEAGSETSCDGKDNDCDGLTDEPGKLDKAAAGCSQGVCKDKAKAICANGGWTCDVSAVTGYQAKELACDGKDNDCDGKTDEADDLNTSSKTCELKLGVCGTDQKIVCTSGKLECAYGDNYEKTEATCDGKDNDCDGQTDKGLCAAGKTCGADSWCDKGTCADVRGGNGKQCTTKVGQCLSLDSKGATIATDNGAGLCATTTSLLSCTSGKWSEPTACPTSAPACHNGKCQLCVADARSCDSKNPAVVLKCDAKGEKTEKLLECPTGKCVGAGLCVVKGVIAVSDGTQDITASSAVAVSDGGFVAAWVSQEPFGPTVKARPFDGEGKPHKTVSKSFDVSDDKSYGSKATNVALAVHGSRYAIAWTSGDGAQVRVHDASDHKLVGKLAATGDSTSDPTRVSITRQDAGFVMAWSAAISGSSDIGIFAQRIDKSGGAIGKVFRVINDTQGREDTAPSVTSTPDGGFLVAWASSSAFGEPNAQIYARKYDKDGKSTGKQVTLVANAAKTTTIDSIFVGQTLFVAWQVTNNGTDVLFATFDADLKAKKTATTAGSITAGAQSHPSFAVTSAKNVLLVFTSTNLSAGSNSDAAIRRLDSNGAFLGKELSAGGDGKNLQDGPTAVSFPDTRELVLWRHRDSSSAKAKIQAQFQ